MSAAVMPTQVDLGESFYQNRRNSSSSACRMHQQQQTAYDRRHFFAITASSGSNARHRNLSGPSATGTRPTTLDNRALATPPPTVACSKDSARDGHHNGNNRDSSHRKLDRSLSDSEDRINGNSHSGRGVNSSRYKTELCRPFEESGHCKYGDKCQFAHGAHELRNLSRHPKYKTERCRTYHTIGFCPYGPRCHFIHNEEERNERVVCRKNSANCNILQQQQQQRILPASSSGLSQRPNNLCGLNSIGSSFESVSTSSSSPGNLSPSLTEDLFPSITTFSPSSVDPHSSSQDSGSPRSSPVFNFPASDAVGVGSILKPLQVQTAQFYNNVVDMAALHFQTIVNISQNQHNNVNSYSTNLNVRANLSVSGRQPGLEVESAMAGADKVWPTGFEVGPSFPPPSTSPVSSKSDDSMGSTGSLESSTSPMDNGVQLVNSPLEVGRSMRLPIFNQLSTE